MLSRIQFGRKIILGCYKDNRSALSSFLSKIQDPLFCVAQRLLICAIVANDGTHGGAIVGRGDGAKSILTSGVPGLKNDTLILNLDGPTNVINTNGCRMLH